MRHLIAILAFLLTHSVVLAQGEKRYEILKDSVQVSKAYARPIGNSDRTEIVIDVKFKLKSLTESGPAGDDQDMIVITEGGQEVARIPLKQIRARGLTTMLAMDVSGSMDRKSQRGTTKMEEAQSAALHFLDRLPSFADVGVILFDHRVQPSGMRYPCNDPGQVEAHRKVMASFIKTAKPDGGTAYLDATHKSLVILNKVPAGDKAVVLMTDGIDLNSKMTAKKVVEYANEARIPVYVIGVGDPGWNEPVSSVLVLDHSGSMAAKAGTSDNKTKIEALHDAASRFVDLMRDKAEATLLPFSSQVEQPGVFTTDKRSLKERIRKLQPAGGTAIYDATYQGIQTVVASKPRGKRYVVVLTDGVDEDPGSRHSPDEVIQLARDEGVPLYLLGLGSKEEINEDVMRRMAKETGGTYDRVENQEQLFKVFEKLSIEIHGDGIDEDALRSLAEKTGGKYYRASDASNLKLLYGEVASELKDTYTVTFPSVRQVMDALPSAIDIYVVDRSGTTISNRGEADSFRAGLVVAKVNYLVYLVLLAGLAGLLWLPSALRRAAS